MVKLQDKADYLNAENFNVKDYISYKVNTNNQFVIIRYGNTTATKENHSALISILKAEYNYVKAHNDYIKALEFYGDNKNDSAI